MEPPLHPLGLRLHLQLIFDLSRAGLVFELGGYPQKCYPLGLVYVLCRVFQLFRRSIPFSLSLYCSFMSLFFYTFCFWVEILWTILVR
jgi:hypothetical protein